MLHRFNLTMDYTFAGAPISARRIRAGRPADEAAVVARLRATGFTQFHAAGGIVTRYGEAVETFTVFPHDDHGELYVQGARGADLARLVKTNRGLEVARTLRLIGAADLLRRNALALGNSPAEHYPDPQGAPAR